MINQHIITTDPNELDHDDLLLKYEKNFDVASGKRPYIEVCIRNLSKYINLGTLTFSRGVGCSFSEHSCNFDNDAIGYDINGHTIYRLDIVKHRDNTVYLSGVSNVLPIDVCYYPKLSIQDNIKIIAELKDIK